VPQGVGLTEAPAKAPRRQGSAANRRRSRLAPGGLRWILPGFVLSVGLIYFCIGYNAYLSVYDYNGVGPKVFVGLGNYLKAFQNPDFWATLRHTLVFFIVGYTGQVVMGFIFAAILHSKVRFAVVYKILIFMPVIIAPAIMSPVHRRVFAKEGAINWILEHIGLGAIAQPWLAQVSTSLFVVIGVQIWSSIGMAFILFYASMGQVNPEMLEAARIDGAGNIRILISIILPNLRGTAIALLILKAITSLKLFEFPYLLTRGGPINSSDFLGTYIHREAVLQFHYGYASALSVILLLLSVVFAIIMGSRARRD
jgi:raffinose/stachyose/melibiose transport system permease protein